MKLLTDENIHATVVKTLSERGFDVLDIKAERFQQLPDEDIISLADKEDRIIITHDKDYLTLTRRHHRPATTIIILPANQPPARVVARLQKLLSNPTLISRNHPCILFVEYSQLEIYKLS